MWGSTPQAHARIEGRHRGGFLREEKQMSVTTVAAPLSTERTSAQALRLLLAAIAIVVLLAAAFVVGRATATSHTTTRSIVPAAHAQSGTDSCPRFRFC